MTRYFRTRFYAAALGLGTLLLAACGSFEQNIEIDLPDGPPDYVVECYLEPDSLAHLSLTTTIPYFETPDLLPVVVGANVSISYNGTTVPLTFLPANTPGNYFRTGEYRSATPIPADYSATYELLIVLPDGKRITGRTTMPPPIDIDTIKPAFDRDEAQLNVEWKDPDRSAINYYRFVFSEAGKPDSVFTFARDDQQRGGAETDFTFTPFRWQALDTVKVEMYHTTQSYYDFYRSVRGAINGNNNPFREPSTVRSNITGGIGVFTALSKRQKVVIIPVP